MTKITALLLALCLVLCLLAGCGVKKAESEEIIVFAAASLTETLTELGQAYMSEHANVNIVYNFDSSGTLKTQIQEGADCDIFISAGQKQMDQLDINAPAEVNVEGLDYILVDTRFDFMENKLALAVPPGNPANVNSFDDLKAELEAGTIVLAVGSSDVPVGQYTRKLFNFYGFDAEDFAASGSITYASNVKEITAQVSETTVDCGIIYQTDAASASLTVIETATAQMCGQVVYPAAILNISRNVEAAQSYLEYLTSDAADAVFEAVGFTPVK